MSLCIAAKTLGGEVVTCYDSRVETPTAQADIAFKSRAVAPHWHVMMASNIPDANEIADIYEAHLKGDASVYDAVIDRLRDPISTFRKRVAEHFMQTRFAVSHDRFMKEGRDWFGEDRFRETLSEMRVCIESREKGVQLLLIGTEDEAAPHIFEYSHGELWECDSFALIGSGETIGEAMLFRRGLTDLSDTGPTAYIVYEAKRMAEITPGVGNETTTMTIIANRDGSTRWHFVSESGLRFLEQKMRRKFGLRPVEDFDVPDNFFSVGYGEFGPVRDDEINPEAW